MLGRYNPFMVRLCYNNAIMLEDEKKFSEAYKCCYEAYEVALEVYGEKHAKTKQYRNMLEEPKYSKFHNAIKA